MKTAPLFSIITICRNAEDLVKNTLQSVFEQTCRDFEYIIIDGASTDNTLPIIEEYKSKISIIVSEPDQGISDAMNKGLRHATGELIIFMHAGDSFASPEILALIESDYKSNKWSWATGSTNFLSAPGKIKSHRPIHYYDKNLLYRYNYIFHQSTVVSTALMRKVGGFSMDFKIAMDYDLWLKLSLESDARILPFTVSHYLLGGVSSRRLKLGYKEGRIARSKVLKRSIPKRIYQEAMAELWYLISDSSLAYRARKHIPRNLKNKVRDAIRKCFMPKIYSDKSQ